MNIAISVEMTLGQRLRNTRQQLHWFGWLLRLVGAGFLIWWTTAPYDLSTLILGAFYLLLPDLLGLFRHAMGRRFGSVYTYTLTEDGISIRTAISNLELAWTALKSVRQTSSGWHLRVSGGGAFTLPNGCFTEEQTAEWRTFLAGRGLVAA
jgi:hypothetical protein